LRLNKIPAPHSILQPRVIWGLRGTCRSDEGI